jgi:SNF2 family DNA or RNA helicase
MPFLKSSCPQCNEPIEFSRDFTIGDKVITRLACGHVVDRQNLDNKNPQSIISLDGRKLYKFQCEGVEFALRSRESTEDGSIRVLIADEMGLGKTVQAEGVIALDDSMLNVLHVVKASLKTQWQHEIMRWHGEDAMACIIESDFVLTGFKHYIVSYDYLRRLSKEKKSKKADDGLPYDDSYYEGIQETKDSKAKDKLIKLIERLKIKTVILDECQQIRNAEAKRTQLVRAICSHVKNVIALSGTPIKNNASEYWPVLNILRPKVYPRYSTFLMQECDSYFDGYAYKTGGLRNPERFLEKTKDYIIRRERKTVLPDLPPIQRNFQFCDLAKEVEQAYINEFKKFRDEYNSGGLDDGFDGASNTLAYLSKMRHLVGLSKIDPCIDHVMEILGSTEDRVCIFTHHNDVADILVKKLNHLMDELGMAHCARHEAGSQARDTEKNFERTRVLVCSTLAGGEGLNLQKLCFRFIMLERQWNPANEEQAEARFPRPEGIKVDSIDGTYFVAVGTVDEFFSEIVERKREIVNKTLSGKATEWDQSSIMKELTEILASSGGRRWSI